jgi:hypothetical protein
VIPPPFQSRFLGDSGVDIATQEIDVVYPDGERRRVNLRVGAPFLQTGQMRIRSELENLDRTDGPLGGEGSLHTLARGLWWIAGRLRVFAQKHGCQYYWPDTDDVFDYGQTLSTTAQAAPRDQTDASPNPSA